MEKSKLSPIELEKLEYLKIIANKGAAPCSSTHNISIYLLGILIHVEFTNLFEEDYKELQSYYQHFQKCPNDRVSYETTVRYQCFTDDRQHLNHTWYCERYPQIHFIDGNQEGLQFILERDYLAFTNDQLNSLQAFGPRPNFGNPDSLDNLVAMIFASCNRHHPALMLHSATIIREGKAWVFFGESGAGKSTLAFHAYQNFGNHVISSDQTLLKLEGEKVYAQSTPITIPELPRDTPMREWQAVEVAGLIHLTQKREAGFRELTPQQLLKFFLEQSLMYLTPYSDQQSFLTLGQEILTKKTVKYGELSYEKASDFWSHLPT